MNSSVIVAQRDSEKLVCNTTGISYTPDVLKHRYGESKRKPLEDWFLDELRFFQTTYPNHNIFTLGSSLVFGEMFITYLTICEFEIKNEEHFTRLVEALKASDQAIRRKMSPMWKWDIAARFDKSIVFMVGWLDLAYFLQHRSDFLDRTHGHYMRSFIDDQSAIKSKDYKVLRDGSIVSFDHEKLSPDDAAVYQNPNAVQYERISAETLV
jgi:hypothetical protein